MNSPRLAPQAVLTADETLASDRLLDELLLELGGVTVVGLDRFRADGAVTDAVRESAQRRASA